MPHSKEEISALGHYVPASKQYIFNFIPFNVWTTPIMEVQQWQKQV